MNPGDGGFRRVWLPRLALLGAVAYLYLNLFALARTPFLLGGDQTYFWMDAQRILNGERVYLDFFQFTPSGTDLVYAALFRLFGPRLWVTNAAVLLLGVALCIVCFAIARRILHRGPAMLAAALVLVLLYGKPVNATHHWFSLLAVMCAVRLAMTRTGARSLLAAGALLGLASFFTQTRGFVALLAFLAFHLWERSRTNSQWKDTLWNQALLVAGFAATLLALSAPFIASAGMAHLWYFQFTYVRQYLSHGMQGYAFGLPNPVAWRTLPRLSQYLIFYVLPFVVYPVALWLCWRERRDPSPSWRNLTLLALTGTFLFAEAASSLNWLRLFSVSMPTVILLLWIVSRARGICRCVFTALWIATGIIAVAGTTSRQIHQRAIVHLPGGTVATNPETAAKLQWLSQRTHPGQFFFQAGWPGLYLPLALRNPAYVDVILPANETRPEDIASTIQRLDRKQVPYVLWPARLDQPDPHPADNVAPLRAWLHSHYTRVYVFPDGDVLFSLHAPADSSAMN